MKTEQINIENGTTLRAKRLELEDKINLANNIEIINSIEIDLNKFN